MHIKLDAALVFGIAQDRHRQGLVFMIFQGEKS